MSGSDYDPYKHPKDKYGRWRKVDKDGRPSVPLPPKAADSMLGVDPHDKAMIRGYKLLQDGEEPTPEYLDSLTGLDDDDKLALDIAKRAQQGPLTERDKSALKRLALSPKPMNGTRFAFLEQAGMSQDLMVRADTTGPRARTLFARSGNPSGLAMHTVERLDRRTSMDKWTEFEKIAWSTPGKDAAVVRNKMIMNHAWPTGRAYAYAKSWMLQQSGAQPHPISGSTGMHIINDRNAGALFAQRMDFSDDARDQIQKAWKRAIKPKPQQVTQPASKRSGIRGWFSRLFKRGN